MIFGKKKEKQEPAPKTETSTPKQKPVVDNPFKNLGDLAKDFKLEQQAKMERKQPRQVEKPRTVAPVFAEKVQREVNRDQGVPRSTGRLSVYQEKNPLKSSKPVVHSVIPSTKDELVRSIIFAELLAPPKSKR